MSSSASLFTETTTEHKRVIAFIDTLRRFGIERDFPIPQIAVAGDQSAGKSSVLELISGIPFPRGTGTVTKCAIRICMSQSDVWSASLFRQPKDGDPTNIENVADVVELGECIVKHQEALCPNGTVSSGVIDITLKAPDVPNLTLIDLPGIVRTTTADQSASMIDQVSALVDSYLAQERTIILAVLESHRDVATQDILTRARKVDSDGLRTIGVLTKPDRVDKGNEPDVLRLLQDEEYVLHHGYYMVKGRGPADMSQTRDEALQAEISFFQTPKFSSAPKERCGIPALASKLSQLLVTHIRKSLPNLAKEVREKLAEAELKLGRMGRAPPATEGQRRIQLQEMIQSLCQSVSAYSESDDGELTTLMTGTCMSDFEAVVRQSRPDFEGSRDKATLELSVIPYDAAECGEIAPSTGYSTFGATAAPPAGAGGNLKASSSLFSQGTAFNGPFGGASSVSNSFGGVAASATGARGDSTGTVPVSAGVRKINVEMKWEPNNKYGKGDDMSCLAFDNFPCLVKESNETWSKKFITRKGECRMNNAFKYKVDVKSNVKDKVGTTFIVDDIRIVKRVKFLDQVKDRLARRRGRVMAGFLNWSVFKTYIKEYVEMWRLPVQNATFVLGSHASRILAGFVDSHPDVSRYPELKPKFNRALEDALNDVKTRLRSELDGLLDKETAPSTDNHYFYDTLNKIRGDRLVSKFEGMFLDGLNYTGEQVVDNLRQIAASCVGNSSNTEQEAQEMVDVMSAYWKVAEKRFVDNVHQCLDTYFVGALLKACEANLNKLIGLSDTALEHVLTEAPELEARRTELQRQIERLTKAQHEYECWEAGEVELG